MTDFGDLDLRLLQARRIAGEAAALARARFEDLDRTTLETKGQQDFVTAADREIEDLVRTRIEQTFPGEGFLGEESGRVGPDDAIWVCDPIDGTTNFFRGLPLFAVTLSFVAHQRTQVGVTEEPARHRTYHARRGGGAWMNDQRIRVATTTDPNRALIGLGFSHKLDRGAFMGRVDGLLERGCEFRRLGSAAICLAYTASGFLDGFWQAHLRPWDVLAGLLLVEEAGGVACDFLGRGGLADGGAVLASVPALASPLGEILGVEMPPAPS